MNLAQISVDSLEFARGARHMAGSVPIRALQRLADALASDAGELSWSVRGEMAEDGFGKVRPYLVVGVSGEISLTCQRCLTALAHRLDVEARLLLVVPGGDWPGDAAKGGEGSGEGMMAEDDAVDPIEALAEQPLLELVEDEVLLALPIAPRHEDCSMPEHDDGRAAASPFAQLAQLKRH